jgi:hypothetical protein
MVPQTAVRAGAPPGRYIEKWATPEATQEAGKTPPNGGGQGDVLCRSVQEAGGLSGLPVGPWTS